MCCSWTNWSLVMCDSCPPPLWRENLRLLARLHAASGQPCSDEAKLQVAQCLLIMQLRWGGAGRVAWLHPGAGQ